MGFLIFAYFPMIPLEDTDDLFRTYNLLYEKDKKRIQKCSKELLLAENRIFKMLDF